MPKYRPVHTKIWKDKDFLKLNKDKKLLFLYLITNELNNNSGIYELPISTIVFESGLPVKMVTELLGDGSLKNIRYDMENEIIFVVNARNYCGGGRPDQVEKGILSEFKQTSKTSLWSQFLDKYPQFKALFNGCPTVDQPLTNGSLPLPLCLDSKDLTNNNPSPSKEDVWKIEKQEAFEKRWTDYPGKASGNKAAQGHWNASIKNPGNIETYDRALENYLNDVRIERSNGFKGLNLKQGSTWFNNWQDWIPKKAPPPTEEPMEPEPPKERVLGEPETEKLWDSTRKLIMPQIEIDSHRELFEQAYPMSLEDGKLVMAVPSLICRKTMTGNYRGLIESTLKSVAGKQVLVDFCIESQLVGV